MNTLMLHNSYQLLGGEDISTRAEARMLQEYGHNITLINRSNDEIREYGALKKVRFSMNTCWNREAARTIGEEVKRRKAEVLHVQNFFPLWSPSVHSAGREAGAATVQHLRNYRLMCFSGFVRDGKICEDCLGKAPLPGIFRGCYRGSKVQSGVFGAMLMYNRWRDTWNKDVDAFITNTRFSRTKFIEAGLPGDRIFVKPNFLEVDPGTKDTGGDYVVYAGRLEPIKGVRTMLKAWSLLKGIPLKIIGEGPLQDEVKACVERQAKEENIEFLGKRPHAEVMEIIGSARVLIMPSEWYETFGRTMMEAFACGVPVIASRLGAMAEIVEDGRTGWHFSPWNAEDLAAKVVAAWTNPKESARRGKEARAEFEARFTAKENYQILMKIYECAIRNRKDSR